jgi:citrate lyase beta subunit
VSVPDCDQNAKTKRSKVRVVGYIREGSATGEPAFAQTEKVRRWVSENGHRLIATCQDIRSPGHPAGREGLQSIIGIILAGQVDGVVVPSLDTFAADKITQEVIMSALRATGVVLLSAHVPDVEQLAETPADQMRALVRHVLDKQARFETILSLPITHERRTAVTSEEMPDVVIELMPAEKGEELSVG